MIRRLYDRVRIEIKKKKLKILYGERIILSKKISFRKRFNVRISSTGILNIGENTFFNNDCSLNCAGKIQIGDYCLFGENVKIYDHGHEYKDSNIPIQDQGLKVRKVTIGNNCWVGSNTVILANVTIGDNVIIGANCLIYKSIPSNSIVKCDSQVVIEKNKYYEK